MKKKIEKAKIELKRKGWTVIKGFITRKQTLKYKKSIFEYLNKNHLKFKGRHINYVGSSKKFKDIHSFHKLESFNKVKDFFYKGKLYKYAYQLLNNNTPELRASELFKKPKNSGLKAAPHQDDYYWNVKNKKGITFWIALDKANKKNGTMYYYSASHKLGLVKHEPSFGKGTSQTIKNKKIFKNFKKDYLDLDVGDVAVHTSLVIHGSEKNTSKLNRAGWTFAVKPKNSPYDTLRTKRFVKSLNKQIKLREKNARI